MKRILVGSIVAILMVTQSLAEEQSLDNSSDMTTFIADELTGDTKLACEAILCLSAAVRSSECIPSITKFFSITAKTIAKTITKRQNFLDLCPTGAQNDVALSTLKNGVLASMQTDCTADYLNSKKESIEKEMSGINAEKCGTDERGKALSCSWVETHYRISPTMPNYCKALMEHEYTDKNFKYTCDGNYLPKDEFEKSNTKCWIE